MRSRWSLFFLLVLAMGALLPPACLHESLVAEVTAIHSSGPEAEVRGLEEAFGKFMEAALAEDAAGVAERYAPDAVLIPPDHPVIRGREAIRVFFQANFARYEVEDAGLTVDEINVCGDWAFARGSVALSVTSQKTKAFAINRFLAVYQKQPDGSWRIARDIWNSQAAQF